MQEAEHTANRFAVTLMMEAISSSETSVNIERTYPCIIPDDRHMRFLIHWKKLFQFQIEY
jgi:hypothetical protein